jgi:hypothetical protein
MPQNSETLPKTKTEIQDIINNIVEATANIPQIPKAQRTTFGASEAAKSFMQRRKSNFARLDQPEDVRRKILQTFSSALGEMEALLSAEGYVLDDTMDRTDTAEGMAQPVAPNDATLAVTIISDAKPSHNEEQRSTVQASDGHLELNMTVVGSVMNLFKSMGHFIDNNIISIAKMVRI